MSYVQRMKTHNKQVAWAAFMSFTLIIETIH